MPSFKKNDYILIIFILSVFAFLTLFIFRHADDNRLTSWAWVFKNIDAVRIYFILILGLVLAYLVSKVSSKNTLSNHPSSSFAKGGIGRLFSFPEHNPATSLFVLSFIIALPFWREPEVIVDASRYFTEAKHLEIYGISYFLSEWGREITVWTDLPSIPFFYGLIFRFLGESRLFIQIFTTLLFSMTVLLIYQIGKTLWDENTGFSAGLLLLGIPYIFTQIPLMLVDVPTMFFLTLSIFTFIKALNHGSIWIAFSSIAIFLTFFSKYSTWPMLSVLIVIFLVYILQKSNPPLPPFAKGGRGGITNSELGTLNYFYRGTIVVLISALLIGIVFLYKFDLFSEQIKLLISYQAPGLRRWNESFISTFFFQVHPFITISAAYSFYFAFKKKDLKYAIISYLVILIVFMQIKRIRYTIIIFPMLTLMASYGLQKIRTVEIRRFVVLSIVISSIVAALFVYLPFMGKITSTNLKDAGDFLNSLKIGYIEVFTLPTSDTSVNPAVSVPIFDLFTNKGIYYDYNPVSSPTQEEIEKSPLRFTWGYKNPDYYRDSYGLQKEISAVMVISGKPEGTLPPLIEQKIKDYYNSKVFKTDEGIFNYKTMVRVFW